MQINLKWDNKNDSSAVVQVFRSIATIDTANPGEPIATLPGTATTYVDTAVLAGVKYYYAVAVSKNGKRVFTPVKTFSNVKRRGPGENRIIYGDERLGYLGKITTDEFIDVAKFLGYSAAHSNVYKFIWHKFIRKGKIIYVSDRPMNHSASEQKIWAQFVARSTGLISGLTWNFDNSSWQDSKKTAIATVGADRLHFRILRHLPDDWNGSALVNDSPAVTALLSNPETEFNELIQPLMSDIYLPNKIGSVRTGLQTGTPYMSAIAAPERYNGMYLMRRLQSISGTTNSYWNHCAPFQRTKEAFVNYIMRNEIGAEPAWQSGAQQFDLIWPAFELID